MKRIRLVIVAVMLVTVCRSSAAIITLNATDTGWWNSTGYHDATIKNYYAGDGGDTYHNYFIWSIPSLGSATILSAALHIYNPGDGFGPSEMFGGGGTDTYSAWEVSTAISALSSSGTGMTGIYDDLGDGTLYGQSTVGPYNLTAHYVDLNLNAAAIAAITSSAGSSFAVGGSLASPDNYIFAFSGSTGQQQLILTTDAVSTVPEPTTAVLWLVGGVVLWRYRARKN